MEAEFIDTSTRLGNHRLAQNPSRLLAVDTEFVRERTYFPKLCLVQTADSEGITLIDAARLAALDPLKPVLGNPATVKVLHSAGQDFEALYAALQQIPSPVFDTQIAAALLGFDDQISYAALVKQLLDVDLPKSQTRTDWCRRPLTPAQIDYATDDVRFLPALYEILHDRLERSGRLNWLAEDVDSLARSVTQPRDASALLQRVGGQRGLSARQRSVVRAIAVWREATARARDIPRKWLLADEAIVEIARHTTTTGARALDAAALNGHVQERDLPAVEAAIAEALASQPEEDPEPWEAAQLDASERRLLSRLQDVVQRLARQLGITPARLASRRELERLLKGERNVQPLRGWRSEVIGAELMRHIATPDRPDVACSPAGDSPADEGLR